jgi:hypothetical protein
VTKTLTREQIGEFLRIVRDDLAFLKQMDFRRPSRTTARVASSILRRLLHEGRLFDAWCFSGFDGEPTVEAVDLLARLGAVPRRYIEYAYAAGAQTEIPGAGAFFALRVPAAEATETKAKEVAKLMKPGLPKRSFGLAEFCASPSAVSGESDISRLHVVRYVADKLGGVHWDHERKEWSHQQGSRDRFLDENHTYQGGLPCVFYEVVAIAQAVTNATDIDKLVERIGQLAPEPQVNPNATTFRATRQGPYQELKFHAKEQSRQTDSRNDASPSNIPSNSEHQE